MKWKNEKEDFSGGSQNIFLILAKKWPKGQDEGEHAKNALTTPNACVNKITMHMSNNIVIVDVDMCVLLKKMGGKKIKEQKQWHFDIKIDQ